MANLLAAPRQWSIRVRFLIALAVVACIAVYFAQFGNVAAISSKAKGGVQAANAAGTVAVLVPAARPLRPRDLLARPRQSLNDTIPKLIHQSWKSQTLPHKFEQWSNTWRIHHPDWEWVLWTNEDNRALVEQEFPWLLEIYDTLPNEIMRADAVRGLYLYTFGGVYADLDVDCIRPLDSMWEKYAHEPKPMSFSADGEHPVIHLRTYMGQMGDDRRFQHSVPNAWFASAPGHPFHLLTGLVLLDNYEASKTDAEVPVAEVLTGPIALRNQVGAWQYAASSREPATNDPVYPVNAELSYRDWHDTRLDELLDKAVEIARKAHTGSNSLKFYVTILPSTVIYPFSWTQTWKHPYCSATDPKFHPELCKTYLNAREAGAYVITYWSHSWTATGSSEKVLHILNET